MNLSLAIISTGFIAIGVFWIVRMLRVMRWCGAHKKISQFDGSQNIIVLIPVLDEAERIGHTAQYFLRHFAHFPNLRIAIITTEAEYKLQAPSDCKTTIDMARDLCKLSPKIMNIHYPRTDGKMAHQLNYAMQFFLDQPNCLFAVYNADSRPDPKTLDWIVSTKQQTGYRVFQQYGNYLANSEEFRGSLAAEVLLAAACWQTRWSIGFELLHALQQPKRRLGLSIYDDVVYPLNYCIGHGLFFTTEIYKEIGGFSETMHNEDAILGLELSYLGERIVPVPFFDVSETPRSIRSLIVQKATWFFGPMQAFTYLFVLLNKRRMCERVRLLRLATLSTKLFSHAVYWVIGPTLFALSIILALIDPTPINFTLVLAEICVFFGVPNTLAWRFASSAVHSPKRNIFLSQLIGGPLCYLFHGLSAYKTLVHFALSAMTGKSISKQKTPAYG